MQLPKDRKGRTKLAAAFAAAGLAYFLYKQYFPALEPQELLEDLSSALGKWTYVLVTAFAFLETGAFVGLVVPGETLVVLGGAIAGQGEISVTLLIALVWTAAFLGDSVSYMIGVKLGRDFVIKHGPRVRITHERFAQVEDYFERHGGKTILIGRFIGLVRALAPFIAGSSGMKYSRMAPFSILGTGIWATFFILLGYYTSQNLDEVFHAVEQGFFFFGCAVALAIGIYASVKWLRTPGNPAVAEAWLQERRWGRWLLATGRRLAPQARFLWQRLTPGGLGVELTGALAALSVGLFLLISYGTLVADSPGPTAGDEAAIGTMLDLRTDWLTDIAKVVTWFGSPGVMFAVCLAGVIGFGRRRHWEELAITVITPLLLIVLVPELKEMIDRPRPSGGLVDAGGQAYPSGHAAYATVYSWLVIAMTVRLRPGWSGGTSLLVAGLLLTAAIGMSRVYLGVHWMSDVIGGWALGASVIAISITIVVVVSYFRQNQGRVD